MLKKFLLPLFALVLAIGAASCSDEPDQDFDDVHNFTKLPSTARNMVESYFSNYTISGVEIIGPANSPIGYEVDFDCGTDIEFDSYGEWTSIDCGPGYTVPMALIPVNILNYVNQYYPAANVIEIDRTVGGYQIELSNDVEAAFDQNGNFLNYIY